VKVPKSTPISSLGKTSASEYKEHMFAEQRRLKIFELIQEEGSARVIDLARIFSVTEPTIRQDLDKLEAEELIVKEHGGAFLKSVPAQVKSFALQHLENMDQKIAIAEAAAKLVEDGESLILDSGSTVSELAKRLTEKRNLSVVTNALNIALLLGAVRGNEVLVTGGEFKPPTLSLTGQKAADFFQQIHVSKLFLATGGISASGELTYPGLHDLPVKRGMIDSATTVYLLADSSKFCKPSLAILGGIELVDFIITDKGISPEHAELCERRGVKTIIA
jgi:DeoR/GlpR family transcriptional regulator of sugar metabolism